MRIALFGGSFNPPHVAHQLAGLYVLETKPVDELWLLPAFRHPFDKALAGFDDRVRMCELAAAPLGPRARVSGLERELGGESLTLRTVRELQARRPGDSLSLIIGSDLVAETRAWYGAEELRRAISFIVVGRAGSAEEGQIAMPAISSTAIRRRIEAGQKVDSLVPAAVLEYIYARGLYRARPRS